MITGFIINLFAGILNWLLGFLPTANGTDLGGAVSIGVTQLGLYVHSFDYFFPASFALVLVGISLGAEGFVFLFKFLKWLIFTIAQIIP